MMKLSWRLVKPSRRMMKLRRKIKNSVAEWWNSWLETGETQ
jgi:hypothetical protein